MSKNVIKNLCKMNITRNDIKKMGLSLQKYDDILRGKSSYKLDDIISLSEKFQLSIDYLITGKHNPDVSLSENKMKLLEYYDRISDFDKGIVFSKAETLAELVAIEKTSQQPEPVKQTPTPIKLKPNPATHIEPTLSEPLSDEYTDTADWVTLTYYDAPASAGHGQSVDTPYDDLVMVPPSDAAKDADYIICVSGDSMEPKYSNGDYVYVKKCDKIEESKIGIFILNGDSLIKQMGNKKLIPLNRNYRDIRLTPEDKCFCQGEVLGKVKDPKTMVWL